MTLSLSLGLGLTTLKQGGGVQTLRYIDGVLAILLVGADGAPLKGADGALLYGVY